MTSMPDNCGHQSEGRQGSLEVSQKHGLIGRTIARAHHCPGAPARLPRQVPSHAQAEAIFLTFEMEFRALEKQLHAHRRDTAKKRRSDDTNVIFKDVHSV